MALWGTGFWGAAKWTEQVGQMAASETGVDVFSGEGDVVLSGVMAATESAADTFSAQGTVTITGQMAATETGVDVFAGTGTVTITGSMAATESATDTFSGEGDVVLNGVMAAAETGVDVFSASGEVVLSGVMAATETGQDVFAATGTVTPNSAPVERGDGVGRDWKKDEIKKRDADLERYKREQKKLRREIERAINPLLDNPLPVVVSEAKESVQVLSVDGGRIGISVPAEFNVGEVANIVAQILEDAKSEVMRVQRRQDAERALAYARAEMARIIKRRRDDEVLLLLD